MLLTMCQFRIKETNDSSLNFIREEKKYELTAVLIPNRGISSRRWRKVIH